MEMKADNVITYIAKRKLKHHFIIDGNKIVKHSFNKGCGTIEYTNAIDHLDDEFLQCQMDLIEICLPKSVKKIGKYVLSSCAQLQRFVVGKNVCSIGIGALAYNSSLVELTVEEENKVFDSRGGCNAIIETSSNTMIRATKNTKIIPQSIARIARDAFDGRNCPSNILVEQGNQVYDSRGNCNAIIETATNTLILTTKGFSVFPKSVTHISENAFIRETYPSHIMVEDGNPVYDSRDNCDAIIETATDTLILGFDNAFIPDDVTDIADEAFGLSEIKSITIPGNVRRIGNQVFPVELENVTIEEGVETIGDSAFWGCRIKKLIIPNSVVEIGDYAFHACHDLEEVVLGKGIKRIGNEVFSDATFMSEFQDERHVSIILNSNNPPEIGEDSFRSSSYIKVPSESYHRYMDDANWSNPEVSAKLCEYRMLDDLKSKKTEAQIERLKILDRCLSSSTGYIMDDICKECAKGLSDKKLKAVGSYEDSLRRTLFNDIRYLEDTKHIKIDRLYCNGHKPYYRYSDPNFSLFGSNKIESSKQPFDRREVGRALGVIQQFSDLPGFEHVRMVIDKLQSQLEINNDECLPSLSLDINQDSSGTKHIPAIQEAINKRKTLKVRYRNNEGMKNSIIIHPHNLTQRKGCWYLFCHEEGDTQKIMALELFKIEKLAKSKVLYDDNNFNVMDHLSDVMGVDVDSDISPVEIELQFSKELFRFVENNPIHGSQTIVKDNSKPRTFKIKVQPNDDFYKTILEFGNDVEVLSPEAVRVHLKEVIENMIKKYR